jgi:hypothetical protein
MVKYFPNLIKLQWKKDWSRIEWRYGTERARVLPKAKQCSHTSIFFNFNFNFLPAKVCKFSIHIHNSQLTIHAYILFQYVTITLFGFYYYESSFSSPTFVTLSDPFEMEMEMRLVRVVGGMSLVWWQMRRRFEYQQLTLPAPHLRVYYQLSYFQ